jgi:hypothetical protein
MIIVAYAGGESRSQACTSGLMGVKKDMQSRKIRTIRNDGHITNEMRIAIDPHGNAKCT